jgi:hypothetical protein
LAGNKTKVVTLAIGSVILGASLGIGHVLWTRSAESEVVHYSWPVKWALTFASESPDLPAGSRFATAAVTDTQGERWTVAGEVELPSSEGRKLVTTYTADVRSLCSNFSERRCWEMAEMSLGSVPAATGLEPGARPADERDASIELASLPVQIQEPEPPAPPPAPTPEEIAAAESELDFILTEPLIEPTDALLEALGGWSTIRSSQTFTPRYDPVMVRDIQQGLAALGYEPGPADGILGRRTRSAIQSFRAREGLTGTAVNFELLDQITRRMELRQSAAKQPEPETVSAKEEPQRAPRQNWLCAGINPKERDCGS